MASGYADDVVLFALSDRDLWLLLVCFRAECETAGMRIKHLQIWVHGSQPEKAAVPSLGRVWDPAYGSWSLL